MVALMVDETGRACGIDRTYIEHGKKGADQLKHFLSLVPF
jgi:hypothetical protein